MKVTVTIRLEEYESLKVESSEHEDGIRCLAEIDDILARMDNLAVQRFRQNSGVFTPLGEFKEPRADGYTKTRRAPNAPPKSEKPPKTPADVEDPPTAKQMEYLKRLVGKHPGEYAEWMEENGYIGMEALDKKAASRLLDHLFALENEARAKERGRGRK